MQHVSRAADATQRNAKQHEGSFPWERQTRAGQGDRISLALLDVPFPCYCCTPLYLHTFSLACSSVRPTMAISGCVKQAAGIAKWSTSFSLPMMFSTALIGERIANNNEYQRKEIRSGSGSILNAHRLNHSHEGTRRYGADRVHNANTQRNITPMPRLQPETRLRA